MCSSVNCGVFIKSSMRCASTSTMSCTNSVPPQRWYAQEDEEEEEREEHASDKR